MADDPGKAEPTDAEVERYVADAVENKSRWLRRAQARQVDRAGRKAMRRRRRGGIHGARAVQTWQIECWVGLQKQAARLGMELETKQDRKRLVIALQREQAELAAVRPCTWATMTRDQRARAIELAARARDLGARL